MNTPIRILTDDQREALYRDNFDDVLIDGEEGDAIISAIEQAVLNSPEVLAMRWQPIETAPMDGRTILLGRFNSHGKWRTMRGQWMSEGYISNHWDEPDCASPGWFETSVEADDPPNCWPITNPTHWMPLPAPPADAAMEKKS